MRESERIPIRFFVITFTWSWILWLPLVLCGFGIIPLNKDMLPVISIPAIGLGAFGPAVGALCSLRTTKGKGAIRTYLKSFINLKFGWKTWIAIFIAFGLGTAVAWIIPECFGGGQEEIGWRGYILPLLEKRFGRWIGSGMLGLIWTFWHLPLWFIPGATQTYMNFGGFIMLMLGYSFFYSWVREASGKRPLAGMIAHGTANAFVPLFPVVVLSVNAVQVRYWIWVSITLAIGVVFLFISTLHNKAQRKNPNERINTHNRFHLVSSCRNWMLSVRPGVRRRRPGQRTLGIAGHLQGNGNGRRTDHPGVRHLALLHTIDVRMVRLSAG